MTKTLTVSNLKRLAVINLGGIGDEILFAPVLSELHQYLPEAEVTLILEKRSQSIVSLLPGVTDSIVIDLKAQSRQALFFKLVQILKAGGFDAVISSGSSPFIAPMLWASGVPVRVGYDSGLSAKLFLSKPAPLNKTVYASQMYYSLAQTFLELVAPPNFQPKLAPVPVLKTLSEQKLNWAKVFLASARQHPKQKVILIHPGVSQMSIDKNILKGWSAEHWVALIQRLSSNPNYAVVLLGGPDDKVILEAITNQLTRYFAQQFESGWPQNVLNAYGQTKSLEDLAALIAEADLLVSVDSAPMHLAVGYHTPTVAMFGPTDEKKLLPPQNTADKKTVFTAVTQPNLSCRPCLWDVRQTSCEKPVCLDVSLETMSAAIEKSLV